MIFGTQCAQRERKREGGGGEGESVFLLLENLDSTINKYSSFDLNHEN